jgi:hypothetical protein
MGRLFHKKFPCFHYFQFCFKVGGNFVAIAMKVHRYSDNYCIPQKTSANTHGLQHLVDFLQVNSGIFVTISTIIDLYIPDFKRLCDTFAIVATLFMAYV